ncbi:MAG: VOC family protein [Gemmatimonadetes bacterium]|uniref:VOC family protein n=1 Tax=Candidatus Kutchimonas denitrificans TaxID=3056748 RepID=A0AAE4Z7B2_9BACT|nr:VOC family protein [Gemmatimonadota bacterium]NIR74037.1 VOC family protein [Candidatus Kutchimonas denitrificans]NIS03026.1 VOC family protein [Gemmatimonadota bacterium]NIT68743.1 VOC family protein [Gemmatimonadota bacterium]NIU53324.1 hypothetical protein [Gemmatimonadota bacterium]
MKHSDIALSHIGQIALTVTDLDRAVAYYSQVLGMRLLFEAPGMAFFACGDVRLMLGTAGGEAVDDRPGTIIYYQVDDIEAAFETLRERGAEVEREPRRAHREEDHELWLAFLRDPDGHVLALMSEVSAD